MTDLQFLMVTETWLERVALGLWTWEQYCRAVQALERGGDDGDTD